jgi:hypothetical protein
MIWRIRTVVHLIAAATSLKDEIVPVQRSTGEASRTGAKERRERAVAVENIAASCRVDNVDSACRTGRFILPRPSLPATASSNLANGRAARPPHHRQRKSRLVATARSLK